MNMPQKYRAWDNLAEFMFGLNDTPQEFWSRIHPASCDVFVMQYIGRLDKDGNRIYECDILQIPYETGSYSAHGYEEEDSGIYRGVVHYTPSKGFILKDCMMLSDSEDKWRKRGILEIRAAKCEVIGNVFENPELLEYA